MPDQHAPESAPRTPAPGGGSSPDDGFFRPPPPEATNVVHPGKPGEQAVVPGEGVVSPHVAAGAKTHADAPPASRGRLPRSIRDRGPTDPGTPGPDEPTGSAGPAAREVSDPNYSAASPTAIDRPAASPMTADPGAPPPAPAEGPPRSARDVTSRIVDAAEPDTDLYTVARMMAELDVSAVPVVDSTDTMRPLGIITDRDIVVRVIAKNQTPDELRAGDVMTPAVITVRTDTPLDECLRRLTEHHSQRAPVVDEQGRVVGIIAQADIERAPAQDPRSTSSPARAR